MSSNSKKIKRKKMVIPPKLEKQAKAIFLIIIILASFMLAFNYFVLNTRILEFTCDKNLADVGEEITFQWNTLGLYKEGIIFFGDGTYEQITSNQEQITHAYQRQGKYRAIIQLTSFRRNVETDSISLEIKNVAPNFDILLQNSALEDELVNLSVINLLDSYDDTDLEKFSYIYDFGDGIKLSTKNRSMIHSWENQGSYNVRITVIDDQGALKHRSRNLEIINQEPVAYFNLSKSSYAAMHDIYFNASGSIDSFSDINSLNYLWDFDDGTISYGNFIIHKFIDSGTYNITLTVRDDDDALDSYWRLLEITNQLPDVNLTIPTEAIIISEGETYVFNALTIDDDTEGDQLLYWWNFNSSIFNPLNLTFYELGGWLNSHTFQDDFLGEIYVAAIDSEGEYDYDFTNIRVNNMDPSVSIYDAFILTNMTFKLYRDSIINNDNNFSYVLMGSHKGVIGNRFNLTGSSNNTFTYKHENIWMSLALNWSLAVNSSSLLSGSSWFQYTVIFEFLDGQKLTYTSPILNPGVYGYWFQVLPDWYDSSNYTFNKPISFAFNIFDPSVDEIDLIVEYNANCVLEINCSNSLPISYSFVVEYPYYNVSYLIEIFEQNGTQYANLSSNQIVTNRYYINNSFPVNIESFFTLYYFMNLSNLLESWVGLTDLTIHNCNSSLHQIEANVSDDDLGQSKLNINLETTSKIEIENLSPSINLLSSEVGKVGNNLTFIVRISDFNLTNYNFDFWNPVIADFGYNSSIEYFEYFANYSSNEYGIFIGNFNFNFQGTYLVTINTTDLQGFTSTIGIVIDIRRPIPQFSIAPFYKMPFEDETVDFKIEINNPIEKYLVIWNFGDGTLSYDYSPCHTWFNAGNFDINLTLIDEYGTIYKTSENITIIEHLPEIIGPFAFLGMEGQGVLLDVDFFDSVLDDYELSYYWFDENDILFSTEKRPVVFLDDGEYNYTLKLFDRTGYESNATITLTIIPLTPEVTVSDYEYYGPPSEQEEGFGYWASAGDGIIKLVVYGSDTEDDTSSLTYFWEITRETFRDNYTDFGGGENSTIYLSLKYTTIYYGKVLVTDESGRQKFVSFTVNARIDSDSNRLTDEFEARLALTDETISEFRDSDGDGLSNKYEQTISNTNYMVLDTDGDGLSDGNLGEANFGTNPNLNDTDHDGLLDGQEILGWNITIHYLHSSINFTVYSNPLVNDTDLDGLLDYDEFFKGTNPYNPDSDNDGLLDNEDEYPAHYDYDNDGLSDFEEKKIGSSIDRADTDGDSINDGDEIYGWGNGFKTNPLTSDSDHDFLTDSAEVKTYTKSIKNRLDLDTPVSLIFDNYFQKAASAQISFCIAFGEASLTYGILDIPDIKISIFKSDNNLLLYNITTDGTRYFSHIIDIKDSIEERQLNYGGVYTISINNTDAGCLLEQFELQVTRYIDPNSQDYDNDGIMDGVEVSPLVLGVDYIDFKDTTFYDNLTVDNDSNTLDIFTLNIPQVGRVYDANLFLNIISEGIPIGSGNISISLIKDEVNETFTDPILIDDVFEYNSSSVFIFTQNLDLEKYLLNNTIFEYYGDYILKISIFNSTGRDNFTLSEYRIQTVTFITGTTSDTTAWITDPTKWDTDGDLWSDAYEIYIRSEPTNPINVDTDGDGAWDSDDRDPLRDVMLQVSPQYAAFRNLFIWERSAVLQIVMSITIDGHDYCYITPERRSTQDPVRIYIIWPFWYRYQYRKAIYNEDYTINIPDSMLRIPTNLQFRLELWHVGHDMGQWDTNVLTGYDTYQITAPGGPTQNLYTYNYGIFRGKNQISVDVKTVAIEKTNTIAIYANDTQFTGHYQTQEKMNIIQLEVTDSGVGTPFTLGLNTIVIPTSLFTKTELNAQIQNEELDSLLFPESLSKFISIERDGTTEEACDEIDFIIIRYEISSTDAFQILTLLRTCLVNETTNETALCYYYFSTKENGTSGVLMNLPSEVLKFIPWDNTLYPNSPQGRAPTGFNEWLVGIIESIAEFVVGIFIAIGEFFILLWEAVVSIIEDVLMEVLPFLADLLLLIIRAVVLILAYIILAISFIGILMMYTAMFITMGIWALTSGNTLEFGLLFLKLTAQSHSFKMEHYIEWRYNEFFDLEFPIIVENIYIDNSLVVKSVDSLILGGSNIEQLNNISLQNEEIEELSTPLRPAIPKLDKLSAESFNWMFELLIWTWSVIPMGVLGLAGLIPYDFVASLMAIGTIVFIIVNFLFYIADIVDAIIKDQSFYIFGNELEPVSALLAIIIACALTGVMTLVSLQKGELKLVTLIGTEILLGLFAIILQAIAKLVPNWFTTVILESIIATGIIGTFLPAIAMVTAVYGPYYLITKTKKSSVGINKPPKILDFIVKVFPYIMISLSAVGFLIFLITS